MKPLYTFLSLLAIATQTHAQQSFFNVPSSDITPKNKLFFQQQISFFNAGTQLNSTFSYGLGNNYEVGANLLGMSYEFSNGPVFNDYSKPYSPMIAVNGQKKFVFTKHLSLGIGTQLGMNRVGKTGAYVYTNGVYLLDKTKTKLVGGLYYSSDGYFGPETRNYWSNDQYLRKFGFQCGIEQNIWNDKLFFQADLISGKHSLGQVVFGAAYCVTEHWVISSGLQVATPGSKAPDELVFELTYVPK